MSGDDVGINNFWTPKSIDVPSGYVSNTALSDSATYNDETFAHLGVTPGIYTWTWGTGLENQTFTLIVCSDMERQLAPCRAINRWWWLNPCYWRYHFRFPFPEWRTPPTWPPPRDLPRPKSGDRGKVVVPTAVIPQR
jgi:hypothetical protein